MQIYSREEAFMPIILFSDLNSRDVIPETISQCSYW